MPPPLPPNPDARPTLDPARDPAQHFDDPELRRIAADLEALRPEWTEAEQAYTSASLQYAEVGLKCGQLYVAARERCRVHKGWTKWRRANADRLPHKYTAIAYWMKAVNLGLNSRTIVKNGGIDAYLRSLSTRPRSGAAAARREKRKKYAESLADSLPRDALRSANLWASHCDWDAFRSRLNHRLHPNRRIRRPDPRGINHLIIDCGEFSLSQDRQISIDEYCRFIEQNAFDFGCETYFVALDHIEWDDPEESAEASFQRFEEMQRRGLPVPVMPVHHDGEEMSRLRYYLDSGLDYICLSKNPRNTGNDDYFEEAWQVIRGHGTRVPRVHALGEARLEILRLYPWASCDSTSWYRTIKHVGEHPDEDFAKLHFPMARAFAWRETEVLDGRRSELEAHFGRRELPFTFNLALANSAWALPTLHVLNHKSALSSYFYLRRGEELTRLKKFIRDPHGSMTDDHFAAKFAVLEAESQRFLTEGVEREARIKAALEEDFEERLEAQREAIVRDELEAAGEAWPE